MGDRIHNLCCFRHLESLQTVTPIHVIIYQLSTIASSRSSHLGLHSLHMFRIYSIRHVPLPCDSACNSLPSSDDHNLHG